MPTSGNRKRQEPELVELAPGVTIPTELVSVFPMPDGRGSWTTRISTTREERTPRLVDFSVHFSGVAPAIVELTDERMRLCAERAITEHAAQEAARRMMAGHPFAVGEDFTKHYPDVEVPEGTPVLAEAELQRVRDRASAAVRPKPGRRAITDEEKLRVLELYRTKGIAETMAITGKKERTVRRYISDARQIERGER